MAIRIAPFMVDVVVLSTVRIVQPVSTSTNKSATKLLSMHQEHPMGGMGMDGS